MTATNIPTIGSCSTAQHQSGLSSRRTALILSVNYSFILSKSLYPQTYRSGFVVDLGISLKRSVESLKSLLIASDSFDSSA